MSEMIKRVGDAFLDALGGYVRTRGPDLAQERGTVIIEACILRSQFDKAMKAAIAALREPTQEMLDAAYDGAYGARPVARYYWTEMMDEVLR